MSSKARKFMSKRNRACDSCRAKKSACRIDSAPPCYLCTLHRKECTFLQPTNRPQKLLQKPSESRETFEFSSSSAGGRAGVPLDNDSMSFDSLMPVDNSMILPQLPGTSSNLEYFFGDCGPALGIFGDDPRPTGFTPNSLVYSSPGVVSPLLEAEKAQESRSGKGSDVHLETASMVPLYLGNSGDMDPFLLQHYRYDSAGKFHFKSLDIQSVDAGDKPTHFLLSPPSMFENSREEKGCDISPPQAKRGGLEAIVPEEIGQRLIALFQRIIVPDYPIFSLSNPLDTSKSPPHLLAIVYLLAQPFTNFDEKLCIELAYEKPSVKTLLKLINDVISYEIYMPTISTIQTLFLLLIRPSANPIVQDSSFKWTQLSTLIACSHSLGLHLDPTTWRISPWEITQRRRLSYCIYMVDKWMALTLGRPPLLNSETWSLNALDGDDRFDSGLGCEEWTPFMKRVELESSLDSVLQLYSHKATHTTSSDYEGTLDANKKLIDRITTWRDTVLISFTGQLPSMGQATRTAIGRVAEMHYHYIHLSIIRATLRPFFRASADEMRSPEYLASRSQVHSQAKTCISTVAGFIRTLGSNDRENFWPMWSATVFSSVNYQILLMAIGSIDQAEAACYWSYLQRIRRDMRLQSDALPHLRLGLLRIDSIFWKGIDTVFSLDEHVYQAYLETTEGVVSNAS
ncbi:transcriptional regulator family: Fungal Specific TF [Penicillium canariense]|uniref:Transcriptional regulator family: Fungal Specific TF n=1 Tax=Penicillium canariense TaxID=189055 RepID=A0A9W9HXC2_9EURO|nr:transcriptional regulator family: Fungal Specific TF [Penicillium canariense]KAJ5160724.1 transcriptional regulator family: Fungal Specific TF [Penicillium canariense]